MFKTVVKSAVLAGLASAAIGGVAAQLPANAAGVGNTVNNCYGQWYNTAWNQTCGGSGAKQTGTYDSRADCTGSVDMVKSVPRNAGSTATVKGGDCSFQVVGVVTSFR